MEGKKNKETTRKQKVYYKHHNYEGGNYHPHIRLAGKYLKEFDFNVGDSIEVYLSKGKITIVKVGQPP